MERRDYLMRQIEMMMQAIVAVIRKLTGLKELKEEQMQQITDDMLFEHLDLSLVDILSIPKADFAERIQNVSGMNENNLELFSEVLVLNARSRNAVQEKQDLLEKAMLILEWTDKASSTFSFDRQAKMNAIRSTIQDLS